MKVPEEFAETPILLAARPKKMTASLGLPQGRSLNERPYRDPERGRKSLRCNDDRFWPGAVDFLRRHTSTAFQGYSCRAVNVVATAAHDPKESAPGKLAKNRRCKSPTGKV